MTLKKRPWQRSSLYLILDAQVCDHARLWDVLQAGVNNGVDIVQLRDKLGTVLKSVAFIRRAQCYLKGRVPFIVNDRADIAVASGASGVHVGQDDLPVAVARAIVGRKVIVGKSCQTLAHLAQAQRDGADYAGFGSVFKTLTKPGRSAMDLQLLAEAVRRAKIPVFFIGGITRSNIPLVRAHGVTRVAVCREILLARHPARVAKELKRALTSG